MNPWNIAIRNISQQAPLAPMIDVAPHGYCECCGRALPNPLGRKPWSVVEDALLIQMLKKGLGYREMASRLARGYSSIHSRITTLKLRPANLARPRQSKTPGEING